MSLADSTTNVAEMLCRLENEKITLINKINELEMETREHKWVCMGGIYIYICINVYT